MLSLGRTAGWHLDALRRGPGTAHWLSLGEHAGAAPGYSGFRPDEYTAGLGLAILELQPELLFIGLGETDECAHGGDYRGYLAALRAADRTIGRAAATLSRFEALGNRRCWS